MIERVRGRVGGSEGKKEEMSKERMMNVFMNK
jgi:hypothetical protein